MPGKGSRLTMSLLLQGIANSCLEVHCSIVLLVLLYPLCWFVSGFDSLSKGLLAIAFGDSFADHFVNTVQSNLVVG